MRALVFMLVFVPFAALASWLHWSPVAAFALAALAIVPLAGLLGESTERLAARMGAGAGGLVNASLGNAAELILSITALRAGLPNVVKASLTGSIIGNSLFVLGLAILAGGTGRERQRFDRVAAGASSTLFALAAIGLVVPAMFHHFAGHAVERAALSPARARVLEQSLSVEISVVLFAAYLLSLLFSLRTHRHLYAGAVPQAGSGSTPARGGGARPLVTLAVATALIAWMSEILVGAVGEASRALGFSQLFVGVILVAIVGNAAEHSTAVLAAMRDRMDLALHIAIGSSIQIALFVAPVLVFLSRLMAPEPMDLTFTPFEVVAVALAVGIVNLVVRDGESNWLEGVLLLAVYLVLGMAFYFLP
ncbi:MAG TPA: calcium/proton exchanger [Candidatus Eisenbacteria bacterium]